MLKKRISLNFILSKWEKMLLMIYENLKKLFQVFHKKQETPLQKLFGKSITKNHTLIWWEEPSDQGGILLALFYAGGYAVGTYVGGLLAKKLIKGTATVQIVSSSRDDTLINAIRDAGFAISVVNVNPSQFGGEKYMIFAEIDTKRIDELRSLIYSIDSKAFITIQESKFVYNGFIK